MYFTIKCVHCMRKLKSEEAVYKISYDELDDPVEYQDEEDEEEKAAEEPVDSMNLFGGMGSGSLEMGDDSSATDGLFLTAEQINQRTDLVRQIIPECTEQVHVPKHVYNSESESGELVTSYRVTGLLVEGERYSGYLRKRRCPGCHKLLLPNAGKKPIYIIGMFGHSTAGKTVFLTMQCWRMVNGSMENMNVTGGRVYLRYTGLHLESGVEDTVYTASKNFKKAGLFPPTTQEIPPPHCIVASYRQLKPGTADEYQADDTSSCVLCFQDIMGELLGRDASVGQDDDFKRIVSLFRNVDGLVLMTDPLALGRAQEEMNDEIMAHHVDDSEAVERMMITLNDYLRSDPINTVKTPTACVLTKQDMLYLNASRLKLETRESALAPGESLQYSPGQNWAAQLRKLSKSTQKVLKKLDTEGGWVETVVSLFTNAMHIPVSSIGSDVSIITIPGFKDSTGNHPQVDKLTSKEVWDRFNRLSSEEKQSQASQYLAEPAPTGQVNPRGLQLPVLYFLSKFGIIPPIDNDEFFVDPNPKQPSLLARFLGQSKDQEAKLRQEYQKAQLQKWLKDYGQQSTDV